MNERARGFGTVAAAYERFRPGYPDELVDAVLAYAGRPVRNALEIGAGTGKATRAFCARGIEVTATDPDAEMLGVLRDRVPGATTQQGTFEELQIDQTFDLVFAAAAMHWTLTKGRWPRVAAMLEEGGVFASFGGPVELADPDLEAAVTDVMARHGIDQHVPSPDGTPDTDPMQWPGTELTVSVDFTDVRQLIFERRIEMSGSDYVGNLATVSAFLCLPEDTRRRALSEIGAVLPDEVVVSADLVLHLARLR